MKTISILKKLINIYYFLLLIGVFFITAIVPILFASDKIESFNIIEGYDISTFTILEFTVFLIITTIIYIIFVAAIYFIKTSLDDLTDENYFSEKVITNFNKSGKLILISGIASTVFEFFLRIILSNKLEFSLDFDLILMIIIGLFLLFLSEVFEKGRRTKQENDLTI